MKSSNPPSPSGTSTANLEVALHNARKTLEAFHPTTQHIPSGSISPGGLPPAPQLQQPRQQQQSPQATLEPSAKSHESLDFSDAFNYAEVQTFAVSPRMLTHEKGVDTVPIITFDVSERKSEQAREKETQERNNDPQDIQYIVQKPMVHGALRSAAPSPPSQGQAPTTGTPLAPISSGISSVQDMTRMKYEMDDIKYSILSHASAMGVNPDRLSEYPTVGSGNNSAFLSMLLQETRLVASKERMAQEQERIEIQIMHEKINQSLLTFGNHQQAQINRLMQVTGRSMQQYHQQIASVSQRLQVLKNTKQDKNAVKRHVIVPSMQRSAAPPLSPSLSRPPPVPISPLGADEVGGSRSHWLNGTPEPTPRPSTASTPLRPSPVSGGAQKGVSVGLLLHVNCKGDFAVAGLTPASMAARSGKIQLGE